MPIITIPGTRPKKSPSQCQRPTGWIGRIVLWSMNRRHSKLTNWGLGHLSVGEGDTILDAGCGGGRTIAKLADLARNGMVHGIDYAPASVTAARNFNRRLVELGRVSVEEASASALPFADDTFDLVTAVETHFWWQDLHRGMQEAFRVSKPGGRMAVIAEFYNGGKHAKYADRLAHWTTMAILDVGQHKAMFVDAGFAEVSVDEDTERGWICVVGTKPL
jgi:ubiquinone/menaquinone biosynthesis C-methylase UbiE